MNVDYLILGQGLCGTFLSYYLAKAGKKVLVIDKNIPFSASKVASGVINPVTGRRIVRTWRIEELLPFALEAYTEFGSRFRESVVKKCNLLDFHPSQQMNDAFENRITDEQEYLHTSLDSSWKSFFSYHFGIGEISPCLLVNINAILTLSREKLQSENNLLEEEFTWKDCVVNNNTVTYKNITAEKIICCDGV